MMTIQKIVYLYFRGAYVTEAARAAFDYGTVAQLFPTRSEADSFPTRSRKLGRGLVGYRRFARAADAIRFAIEELPAGLLPDACLEVDAEIFDRDAIRRLYDSDDYPLARRAAPVRGLEEVGVVDSSCAARGTPLTRASIEESNSSK
jgi:hypothetical protein